MTEQQWKTHLATLPCLVGRRHGGCQGRINLHHVAEGSSVRSVWALVPLCEEHHTGGSGLHTMGTKKFVARYRPYNDQELGLLAWLIEDLAK